MASRTTLANATLCRALGISWFLAAAPIGAQAAPEVTLRLFTRQLEIGRGALLSADSSALSLRLKDGKVASYPRSMITRVELLAGTHRAGLSDVGKGAAIGLGLAGLLGLASVASPSGNSESREMAGFGAIVLTVFGTAAGTLVGVATSFRHVDEWQPLDLGRVEPSASGRISWPREVSMGDTVRFGLGSERIEHALLLGAAPGALVVRPLGESREMTIRAAEMVRPEVLRGRRLRGARAIAVGALIGATAGMVYGFRPHPGGGISSGHPIDVLPLLGGFVAGTAVGSLVAATPTQDWRAFDPVRAAAP